MVNDNNLFDAVIDAFGDDHQLGMVEEELLELATAIKKYRRKVFSPEAKKGYPIDVLEKNIIEEMADVMIVLNYIPRVLKKNPVLREKFNSVVMLKQAEKIDRLEKTLKAFKERK